MMPDHLIDVKKLIVIFNDGSTFSIDFSKCSFDGDFLNGSLELGFTNVDIDEAMQLFDDCLCDIPVDKDNERKVFNV